MTPAMTTKDSSNRMEIAQPLFHQPEERTMEWPTVGFV